MRKRIRDLFGRHVGRDVAAAAEAEQIELGGEERHVAVLFADIIGSNELAEGSSPTDVVALLNRFFAVIIEEVNTRRGLVNKFEGDALLAIFGAPVRADSPETDALSDERFDYTVIGDPVNQAARISGLAKSAPPRILASAAAVDASHPDERKCWQVGAEVTLRGRERSTRLATPGREQ